MSKRPTTALSDELIDFIAQGVSLLVGTCDASQAPHAMRAVGIRIHDDRRHATVYLPEVTSRHTVTDVAVNPRVAVLVSQPTDHRSFQMKGSVTKVSPAGEPDRALIEAYLGQFGRQLETVGMPFDVVSLLSRWPAIALELQLEELYLQTPGPGAGQRLAGQSL
ncbi:MAG TPA: pyridoxamine 5'-phosphate oxidase family protein [Polyangiales bacterium]|nr:pyridoxamine 5'-phosphate oxidase family protein [Polyangiales bacterium]